MKKYFLILTWAIHQKLGCSLDMGHDPVGHQKANQCHWQKKCYVKKNVKLEVSKTGKNMRGNYIDSSFQNQGAALLHTVGHEIMYNIRKNINVLICNWHVFNLTSSQ